MFRVSVNVTKKKSVILFAPGVIGEANGRETERPRVCVSQFTHVVDLIAVAGGWWFNATPAVAQLLDGHGTDHVSREGDRWQWCCLGGDR